jgi:hypothetical protein
MESEIRYDICAKCGADNLQLNFACQVCGNRLYSIGEDAHERYVAIVQRLHRKRTIVLYLGWPVVTAVLIVMPVLDLTGHLREGPTAGVMFAALLSSWRLVDLKKKRLGSLAFIQKYKSARL